MDTAYAPGLLSLAQRHGKKPYHLFQQDGTLRTHRVIYTDPQFGTEVWLIDPSPTADHAQTASIWPDWNANASILALSGLRPDDQGRPTRWLVNQDYSRLTPSPVDQGRIVWDPEDPDLFFVCLNGKLVEARVSTGQVRTIAAWEAYPRERVYGLTSDQRHIFVDTPNGGIWLPYEPGAEPIQGLPMYDGRPGGPDAEGNPVPPRYAVSELMFRGEPRGKSVAVHDQAGHLFLVRIGMLIDRHTGEIDHVIAPVSGQEAYLRTFASDRVHWPEGPEWSKYRYHSSTDIEELFEIYRYYPMLTHGHEAHSPDGEYIAKDGAYTKITRIRDGSQEQLRISPDGGSYHLHWQKHPRFFTGWIRGWRFGDYVRPEKANELYQIFSDRTYQPILNTYHKCNSYYGGGDFTMLSPDTTKVHYGSSMTGRFHVYAGVMARPRPPKSLTWQAGENGVRLAWEPSGYHKEIEGYLVYRSEQSGSGYVQVTPTRVKDLSWTDTTVQPGRAYYYVVTALEYSGLESGCSHEVVRAGVQLPADNAEPVVVYQEAEAALWDLYTTERPGLAVGVDRREASDWYYLYRHPEAASGEAVLPVMIPVAGHYYLWARLRCLEGASAAEWQFSLAGCSGAAETTSSEWTWVCVWDEPVALEAGTLPINLRSTADGALDVVCLATDDGFCPTGIRPEADTEPQPVTDLTGVYRGERTNELSWQAADDPARAHFHVYAAEEPIGVVEEKYRLSSPTEPMFLDWGLKAGTRYYYAVTAVNRRGQESAPTEIQVVTDAEPQTPWQEQLAFAEAACTGSFERATAAGLRGEAYLVPKEPASNSVCWEIDVPHDGEYYFWLRYLQRGTGARGDVVNQQIQAELNGEVVTRIGGGPTDLHVSDEWLATNPALAEEMWTWAWPGVYNLEGVRLPKGKHRLCLRDLDPGIRYDVLLVTNEPSFQPQDGRLRQM